MKSDRKRMTDAAYDRRRRKTAKFKEWSAAYRAKPEVREKHRQARKRYVDANPEKMAASRANCRARGRELARKTKDVPCADCGGRFPIVCMDFDHRPGEEKHPRLTHRENGYKRLPISMTAFATQSMKLFEIEAKKCDVVCANCHRIRTWERCQAAKEEVA